jgi:glycosyltransferase involved in cell wall biosynthesis
MSKKLKINILLYHPGLGGGDRVVAIYAAYLRKRGHEVVLTGLKVPRPRLRKSVADLLRSGKLPGRQRKTHFDSVGIEVRRARLAKHIGNEDLPDADIVIATFWPTAEWADSLASEKGAPVYFVQNYESLFPHSVPERVDETYRLPLKTIVISKWLDALMREKFGVTPVALIPNSVDYEQFFAPPRTKNKTPCIGFLYGESTIKGVDVTLKAIAKIRTIIPNLKVVAFGASPISAHLPLPSGCDYQLSPEQHRIREIYAQCDVWMCGSRMEGFHLPPMEAMACRCPVVSTAVGGPVDVIENGIQGYVVQIEDADALAEKTLSILQGSDADWRRMSDAAYATATSYSWDDAGAQFEAVLLDIAAAKII